MIFSNYTQVCQKSHPSVQLLNPDDQVHKHLARWPPRDGTLPREHPASIVNGDHFPACTAHCGWFRSRGKDREGRELCRETVGKGDLEITILAYNVNHPTIVQEIPNFFSAFLRECPMFGTMFLRIFLLEIPIIFSGSATKMFCVQKMYKNIQGSTPTTVATPSEHIVNTNPIVRGVIWCKKHII